MVSQRPPVGAYAGFLLDDVLFEAVFFLDPFTVFVLSGAACLVVLDLKNARTQTCFRLRVDCKPGGCRMLLFKASAIFYSYILK